MAPRVALALSGGGVRAAAHLGIAEVLMREGIAVEALSGSSGGALAGVLLCNGYSSKEVFGILGEVRRIDLLSRPRRDGMFSLGAVEALLKKQLGVTRLEALQTPCIVAATDLKQGRMHYFEEGPAATLAVASSSLVPFFPTVSYGDLQLCDGGFMDNMPARPLTGRGLPVVGVNVNPILPQTPRGILQKSYRTLVLMMAANIEASKRYCDLYLEVEACGGINIFDTSQMRRAYDAGAAEAERRLPELMALADR